MADWVTEGLIKRGMDPRLAAAFGWNGQDEAGLKADINEANPVVAGSRGGYGVMQWTGPRRKAFEAFAAERGVSPSDQNAQLDFIMAELNGPEKSAWAKISAAKDTPQAAAAIVNYFLRPAEERRARREAKYLAGNSGFAPPADTGNALATSTPPQRGQNQLALQEQKPQFTYNALQLDPSAFMRSPNALYRQI